MTTRRWLAAALAAGMWGIACAAAASPEYRKDPEVRAAIEQKLKTFDEAEIRKRWGAFADLVGKPWLYHVPGSANRAWFSLEWAVQGAVIDYAVAWCRDRNCEVRKAVLVHKPAPPPAPEPAPSSSGFSLSGLTRSLASLVNPDSGRPTFDVLWEDGRGDGVGVVHEDHVGMGSYTFRYLSDGKQAQVDHVTYSATTLAEIAAATGYSLNGAPAPAVASVAGQPATVKTRPVTPVAPGGSSRAGLLGARIRIADATQPLDAPVVLEEIEAGGPAAAAGLMVGDAIASIGTVERPTMTDVLRAIAGAPGQVLPVVVTRSGQSVARSVKLGERTIATPCLVVGLGIAYQYAGECRDGFADGRGEVSWTLSENGQPLAARYAGSFRRGALEAMGTLTTSLFTYEGGMAAGMRHGRGKLTYFDGRPGFEGEFAFDKPVGLKPFAEALFVCTRPDPDGNFECDAPHRAGLQGGKGQSPAALLDSLAEACPSKRRLPSRTHLVWGCGFGATNAPGAADRGNEIEVRGRGTYQCLEREAACKRTRL